MTTTVPTKRAVGDIEKPLLTGWLTVALSGKFLVEQKGQLTG
jgi:hypothetical protein